jgi:WD40 repeat protein
MQYGQILALSPDKTQLATTSAGRTVQPLETLTGTELARMPHDSGVEQILFSPDGLHLATRTGRTAILWAT